MPTIEALTWENEARPQGADNTRRPLTHSSDLTREGMAMQATRYELNDPRLPERFWAKVQATSVISCWQWTGSLVNHGYGQIFDSARKRSVGAHRYSYEKLVGPIPDGLHIDHLCRNRGCVNPAHLEAVTPDENCRRGLLGGPLKATDVCRNGLHPWPESTFVKSNGALACRPCHRAVARRSRAKLIQCEFCGIEIQQNSYVRHRRRWHAGSVPTVGYRRDRSFYPSRQTDNGNTKVHRESTEVPGMAVCDTQRTFLDMGAQWELATTARDLLCGQCFPTWLPEEGRGDE